MGAPDFCSHISQTLITTCTTRHTYRPDVIVLILRRDLFTGIYMKFLSSRVFPPLLHTSLVHVSTVLSWLKTKGIRNFVQKRKSVLSIHRKKAKFKLFRGEIEQTYYFRTWQPRGLPLHLSPDRKLPGAFLLTPPSSLLYHIHRFTYRLTRRFVHQIIGIRWIVALQRRRIGITEV